MDLSYAFKRFRLIRGKTVEEISGFLGVDEDIYRQWETGESEPSIEQVMDMATYYDCSMELLLDVDYYKSRFQAQ